jgi:hypothetical protein
LELASVREFSVVDLPDDGFPTSPMRGSRGILGKLWIAEDYQLRKRFEIVWKFSSRDAERECGLVGLNFNRELLYSVTAQNGDLIA